MKTLNREQRRYIKGLNKDQLIKWLSSYGMEMYNDGVRDSFYVLLLELHDKFDFGNQQIEKLLKSSEVWMNGIRSREDDIDRNGIKQALLDDGITCIKDTDL